MSSAAFRLAHSPNFDAIVGVATDAATPSRRRLSDHGALAVSLQLGQGGGVPAQTSPDFIFKLPLCKKQMELILNCAR
eukprot:7768084-Pyramimonas_sp.AAC.1